MNIPTKLNLINNFNVLICTHLEMNLANSKVKDAFAFVFRNSCRDQTWLHFELEFKKMQPDKKNKSTNLSGKTLFLCEKTDLRLIAIIIEMQKKRKKKRMTLQPFLPFKFFSLTEHFLENL